jgi:uncharacterized protein YuzE
VEDKTVKLTWDREHNIADLQIADGPLVGRGVDAREIGDELVLDLDGSGAVLSVQILDPATFLAGAETAEEALARVLARLADLAAA